MCASPGHSRCVGPARGGGALQHTGLQVGRQEDRARVPTTEDEANAETGEEAQAATETEVSQAARRSVLDSGGSQLGGGVALLGAGGGGQAAGEETPMALDHLL